ncbi:MAG: BolA/IbaG family iron-sulfur metabolism protein [Proteobacteria bacterium]|nr:BolA/IbaG family iron-sulfur metabolism protein [Pseudomonadota bacterium]
MSNLAQTLKTRIQQAIPGAQVHIDDPDGAHLSATITSAAFAGKSRIQQHQMVYAALGNAFETDLHALQLTTKAE